MQPLPGQRLSAPASSQHSYNLSMERDRRPQQQQQQERQPQELEQYPQQQSWSILGALSVSLYQSMSFSRSPSFERTRYIVSTCTFITIIYLRTLHCLFFGTGALSCAVLAKCLKHTIRQPRPEKDEPTSTFEMDEILETQGLSGTAPASSSPASSSSSSPSSPSASSSSSSSTSDRQQVRGKSSRDTEPEMNSSSSITDSLHEMVVDSLSNTDSPTLSLAPTTTLQKEQMDATNEPKARLEQQRLRRQWRRKFYSRKDYGMPSSHAQLVAFFVSYISLQLVLMEPEGSAGQWFLILLLQLYAWSVVWSRVRLGRHTVCQVLVGAAVGTIYGMVWFAIWSWKVEDMIKHWQWMDRYGVIQVRKMWKHLDLDQAIALGRAGGRMYLRQDEELGRYLRL